MVTGKSKYGQEISLSFNGYFPLTNILIDKHKSGLHAWQGWFYHRESGRCVVYYASPQSFTLS